VDGLPFDMLEEDEARQLEKYFMEEVLQALNSMKSTWEKYLY
jgi:hypothetical protein